MQIDLDALERKYAEADPLTNDEECYQRDILALIAKVRELQANRDCWAEQASQRVKDWDDMRQRAEAAEQRGRELEQDAARLDALRDESWDLRCFSMSDDDIGWRVIEHHMAAPHERVVAELFNDDPRAAIDAARGGKEHG